MRSTRNTSSTFGPHDLFQYNTQHRVLICRECKYAIQKSALGSHLLRHKIYRGERQHLLSSIAQLQLLEPDDVLLPPVGSPQIDGLPVIMGYRCTAARCGSLCASSKRMRRHWSESHSVSDPPSSCGRPVNLQTFFRGTKIRYFEVTPSMVVAGRPLVSSDRTSVPRAGIDHGSTAESLVQALPSSTALPLDFDLETLRYFHHFTTATSLTLPSETHEPVKHWQNEVVAQALQLRWLMCGLLSISASHLASLSGDETTKPVHQMQSARFLQEFSAGWEEAQYETDVADYEASRTGAQMGYLLRCCHWIFVSPDSAEELILEQGTFQLQSFATALRGCAEPNFALRSVSREEILFEEIYDQAMDEIDRLSYTGVPKNVPPAQLERLRSLPYRIAEALGKPKNALDVFATITASDMLTECYFLSYASNDMSTVWIGMMSWLKRVSNHFNGMISRRSPDALIVLAHWTLLVQRAEHHYWFLRGLATKIVQQILKALPKDAAVQGLVANLTG